MGSLESGLPLKRDQHFVRSSSGRGSNHVQSNGFLGHRPRSRFARLVLFKKIDYLLWICTVAVFFFVVFLFQMFFLPGSITEVEKSHKIHGLFRQNRGVKYGDFSFLKELDFGEDIRFEPSRIVAKFQKEVNENRTVASRKVMRFGYRKPKLALVFADLSVDPYQILMVTVAAALQEIGYEIEVFSLEDGPAHAIWRDRGLPLSVMVTDENAKLMIDWLNYDGVLVNSLKAVSALSCLMQEPFRNVPLIWTIHEQTLAARLRQYFASGQSELVDNWKKVFSRATVVIFPNYVLPVAYSLCDPGNFFVIPGSPAEPWKADKPMVSSKVSPRLMMGYGVDDFVVAVVGTQLLYGGLWLEHALVLQALLPVLSEFNNYGSRIKIIILAGDSSNNFSTAVETIALSLRYPKDTVKHVSITQAIDNIVSDADLVLYGSFREEQSFPEILLKAMSFEKPIIAPDLSMIRKYVSNRVNGYLFPKEDVKVLTQIMFQMVSNGKLSLLARSAASVGKQTAKNMMVPECVEGYASLLEKILVLPSEVSVSHAAEDIPAKLKAEWQWHYFEPIADTLEPPNKTSIVYEVLDKIEKQFNHTHKENMMASITTNDTFLYSIWEEHKSIEMTNMRKRREDEELKDRTDQPRGTWDEVYRSTRRVDRTLHERDEGELERTGQPLCIYEPYFGEGTWPFLHHTSLYRGLGLSTKGRRRGADDIDGPSRLPLLSNAYYRAALGDYGAIFAIANRIDRIHKNAWIGFQSWRATAKMKSLSKTAEKSLLDAIEARRHGDTLYFWASMELDHRNPLTHDFWSFCDAINAGNCQFAFSEAMKKMYGVKHNSSSLPPMPAGDGTWSVTHCWSLPTKSFLEFVMFSRMFVDALDAQFYDEHQKTGHCYLSLAKDKHCYSRLLELLINVWAYHSARKMVYINPETGVMQEQHSLKNRRGRMWVKWFNFDTLKSMDEDLAEEFDSDHPRRRWLWPSTGEIFWRGMYEKERSLRNREREKKRQQSKDKIQRIRKRTHQKVIGKYTKPSTQDSNTTVLAAESEALRGR